MSWKKELEEKLKREKLSEKLGGSERVKRQHDSGRYTVRERIHLLTDKNSFQCLDIATNPKYLSLIKVSQKDALLYLHATDKNNKMVGFDIDLVNAIAARMNKKIKLKELIDVSKMPPLN